MTSRSTAGSLADGLDVELGVLAVAPGLHALVAKDRAGGVQLDRLRPRLHAILDVGAHDAGGELRAAG